MLWARGRKDKTLAAQFVAAVNARDVPALEALLHRDFAYIDSWREGIVGRDNVIGAVRLLFESDPGFHIEVEHASYSDPHVLMRGWANSAIAEFGRRRAVWRARCEDGVLVEWQAWAEGGPPRMARTYAPVQATDLSARAMDLPEGL